MALSVAVLDGDKQAVYDLIFNDADVNEPNDVGNRPLHAAAFKGNVELGRLLVRAGAKPNVKGNHGRTPLHIACADDTGEAFVRFLLDECRVDPRVTDNFGKTPRDYASPRCAEVLDSLLFSLCSTLLDFEEDTLSSRRRLSSISSPRTADEYSTKAENLLLALTDRLKASAQPVQGQGSAELVSVQQQLTSKENDEKPRLSPRPSRPSETSSFASPKGGKPLEQIDSKVHEDIRDDGFFIEVDGTEVFVPFRRRQSEVSEIYSHASEEENSTSGDADHELRLVELPVRVVIRIGIGEGLGMLLEEVDGGVRVQKLRPGSKAEETGIRVGDLIVSVNDIDLRSATLEEAVSCLDASQLEIRLSRFIPKIVLEAAKLDWTDPAQAKYIFELVEVLRDPPAAISQDEMMVLIQSFQQVVNLVRRGSATEALKRFAKRSLEKEAAENQGDISEAAATVVHRAVRHLEEREQDGDGVFAGILNL